THRRILRINRLVPGGGTRSSRLTQPRSRHQGSLIGSHQAHAAASCRATVKRHRVVAPGDVAEFGDNSVGELKFIVASAQGCPDHCFLIDPQLACVDVEFDHRDGALAASAIAASISSMLTGWDGGSTTPLRFLIEPATG